MICLQVVQFIKEGSTLECPENTPKSIYKVMSACWAASPSSRPCFRSVTELLTEIGAVFKVVQNTFNINGAGFQLLYSYNFWWIAWTYIELSLNQT